MYHQAYIQSILDFNVNFYIYLSFKQITLLNTLLDYIVKLLYNMPKVSINHFTTYYLSYKKKSMITEFIYKLFFCWLLFKLLTLPDVSSNFIIKVIAIYHLYYKKNLYLLRKKKLLKTSLYCFQLLLYLSLLLLCLTFSKICLVIFKYLIIFKCTPIFE